MGKPHENPEQGQIRFIRNIGCCAAWCTLSGVLLAGALFLPAERADAGLRGHAQFYSDLKAAEARWQTLGDGGQKQWGGMQQLAEQKWRILLSPDPRHWVDDNPAAGTRSRVDFENGTIEVETILLEDFPNAPGVARDKILSQVKDILDRREDGGGAVLKNQLCAKNCSGTSNADRDDNLRETIQSSVSSENVSDATSSNKRLVRYTARIDLVPDHVDIRARRYLPYVMENANRFNLDPRLIMAIIHTESFFNPLAVSEVGAVGLMQIMPNHAGREVFGYLYEQPGQFSIEALYSPRNNIQTGTAYLYLLKRIHFADIRDYRKNTYLAICAYNWGPNAVRRNILDRYDVQRMSADELYALLMQKTPNETKNYLEKVVARIDTYDALGGS